MPKIRVLEMVLSFHEKTATLFQNIRKFPEDITGGTVLNSLLNYVIRPAVTLFAFPQKQKSYLQIFLSERAIFVRNINCHSLQLTLLRKTLLEIDQALSGGFLGFMGLAIIAGFFGIAHALVFPQRFR
ncbi:MAG: hypothetical protein CM1200mP30_29400 [Pseudomonadota bacterium]|nr:MAG: hypothetical protein CM1200mP30_29400 [Pseudomonadota bacterium]